MQQENEEKSEGLTRRKVKRVTGNHFQVLNIMKS